MLQEPIGLFFIALLIFNIFAGAVAFYCPNTSKVLILSAIWVTGIIVTLVAIPLTQILFTCTDNSEALPIKVLLSLLEIILIPQLLGLIAVYRLRVRPAQ